MGHALIVCLEEQRGEQLQRTANGGKELHQRSDSVGDWQPVYW